MLCPSCHTDVPANAAFCPKCGQRLGEAAAADLSAADKLRAASAAAQGPPEPEHDLWHGKYSPKAMFGWMCVGLLISISGPLLLILRVIPDSLNLLIGGVILAMWVVF